MGNVALDSNAHYPPEQCSSSISVRLFIFLNLICISLFLLLFRFMKQRLSRSVSKRAGANLSQFGPPNLDLPLAMGLQCLQMYLDV